MSQLKISVVCLGNLCKGMWGQKVIHRYLIFFMISIGWECFWKVNIHQEYVAKRATRSVTLFDGLYLISLFA